MSKGINLTIILLVVIFTLIFSNSYSQGPGPGPGTPCPDYCAACAADCDPCTNIGQCQSCVTQNCQAGVPIDGGLSWLIVLAIGFGIKTFSKRDGSHSRKNYIE